jgi:hypothetical protein
MSALQNWQLPPGLRELADAENLNESQVKKLSDAWGTIRGRKPQTLEEWMPLYRAVKHFLGELDDE